MIELQHDDVRLAAVDAGMSTKVLDHSPLVVSPPRGRVPKQPRLLSVTIQSVVLPPVRREALTTPRLQLRLATSHRRKLIQRLQLAAFRARSHEGERADISTSFE